MQCKDTQSCLSSPDLLNCVTEEFNTLELTADSKCDTVSSLTNTVKDSYIKIIPKSTSGETCKPSEDSLVSSSSWWVEALAKTTQEPTLKAKDFQAIALACGGSNSESSKNVNLLSPSGKIPQDADIQRETTGFLPLEPFYGRLSPAGMCVSGNPSELVMLERHTKEIASSLLHTPLTCFSDSKLYRSPGRDKLEAQLETTLQLMIPENYVSHPHIREWMMGLPLDSTRITEMVGGVPIPSMGQLPSLNAVSLTEAIALPLSETPALHNKQPSAGNISTTSPDALNLQPTEADTGKEVYVDVVEKRGEFRGGIHEHIVLGTTTTFAVVKFADCQSVSLFPLAEIELVPEEKATAPTAAEQINTKGEYSMLTLDSGINAEIVASSDKEELTKLESEIEEIQKSAWYEIGSRLLRIRDGKLYPHKTWDAYCRERWNYGKSYANDLINAVKAQEVLTGSPVTLTNPNQAIPIRKMIQAGVQPEQIQELVTEVAESGLSADKLEQAAQGRGLLPVKQSKASKDETTALGQKLGLKGNGSQQLPDIESNADIPPERVRPSLLACFNLMEVSDFIRVKQVEAIAEFVEIGWQERFRLRTLTQGTIDNQLMVGSTEQQCRKIIGLLDKDKDSKIEWLEARVAELEAKLIKPASTRTDEWYTPPEYIEMAREVMGSIDLDPASNELAQSWIKAAKYYTKEDDGLRSEWDGNVWYNPHRNSKMCSCKHHNSLAPIAKNLSQQLLNTSLLDQIGKESSDRVAETVYGNEKNNETRNGKPSESHLKTEQSVMNWLNKAYPNAQAAKRLSLLQTYTFLSALIHEQVLPLGVETAIVNALGLSSRNDAPILWSKLGFEKRNKDTTKPQKDGSENVFNLKSTTTSEDNESLNWNGNGHPQTGSIAKRLGVIDAPIAVRLLNSPKITSYHTPILNALEQFHLTLSLPVCLATAQSNTDPLTNGVQALSLSDASLITSRLCQCGCECVPVFYSSNVWINPPYGRSVEDWLVKAIGEYNSTNVKSAILLLNRTGAAWYKKRIKEVTAICEVHKRIAFIDENGQRQDSPRYYNDFLYLGEDVEKFREVFSRIGDVTVMQPGRVVAA